MMGSNALLPPRVASPTIRYLPLFLIVAAGVVLRVLWLDRLTGIDGDEAWYGILGQHWAQGDFIYWRTPTGNYPGPIQPALVALGQFFLPSQFIVLRIPSLIASLAAMALAWHIARRHLDGATSRIALVLMAALPANIAYARFGWDPSLGGMIFLAGLGAALDRRLVITALLFGLGIWTHPTNVFAAPMLLIVFMAADRREGGSWLLRSGILVAVMLLLTGAMMSTAVQSGQFTDPLAMFGRLVSPGDWSAFLVLFGRLIMGQPWFVHLAGTGFAELLPLADLLGLAALAATIIVAAAAIRNGWDSASASILAGWLGMIVAYALIGGYASLNAPTERYAFVLIAPTAMVLAITLRKITGLQVRPAREAVIVLSAGALLIGATIKFYMIPLATQDSIKINNFKTGPIEPKEAAARWIIRERRHGPLRIVAESGWISRPLSYRLAGQPITVVNADWEPAEAARRVPEPRFYAAFAGSTLDRQLAAARPSGVAFTATGYDGRPILRIWEGPPRP